MAEEPSLPDLLYGPPKKTVHGRSSPRKHARFHNSSHFSSDPPLFSSDDDPGLDNYTDPQRRHKRKYRVGPYSHQHPLKITSNQGEDGGTKRKLQRHLDSAVFLESDGTENDTDVEILKSSRSITSHITLVARPSRNIAPKEPSVDDKVRKYIEDCLENAEEVVDLTAWDLLTLSNSAVKPLASFSPLAVLMRSGGSQHQPEPALKIYLARNSLKSIPTEIFKLEHLGVLSLRNNELAELPEVIGTLTSLKEFNVANNALQWLPYNLLKLLSGALHLTTLSLSPNPFLAPRSLPSLLESRQKLQLGTNWEAHYCRRSYVRFMDRSGRLLKGPDFHSVNTGYASSSRLSRGLNVQLDLMDAEADDVPRAPSGHSETYVPSLEEMCIKAWAKTPENTPGKYDAVMPSQRLSTLMEMARSNLELEGRLRNCTVCGKEYVTPRTEWIEWWAIYSPRGAEPDLSDGADIYGIFTQDTIPLMRRGCSWRCLPE